MFFISSNRLRIGIMSKPSTTSCTHTLLHLWYKNHTTSIIETPKNKNETKNIKKNKHYNVIRTMKREGMTNWQPPSTFANFTFFLTLINLAIFYLYILYIQKKKNQMKKQVGI